MLNYTLKTDKVMDGDEVIVTVRGLSPTDIVQLIQINRPAIEELFNRFSGREPETIDDADVAEAGLSMIEAAPGLVAHIIALAADALDQFDQVLVLPVGVQVEALEKIGKLTFSAGGGPKKVMALAMKLFQSQGESQRT